MPSNNDNAKRVVDHGKIDQTGSAVGNPSADTSIDATTAAQVHADAAKYKAFMQTHSRYEVKRLLGRGGMGVVFLAKDNRLNRSVAIKMPFLQSADDSRIVDRFERESQAMASIQHPNICPVFDAGSIQGVPFMSMAYVNGIPLSDAISKTRPSEHAAATIVLKIAKALAFAHNAGVIHRDLKPANIMLSRDNEPIVMDFGLARFYRNADINLTQSGALLGTPAYMAPEQVEGDPTKISEATDVYAIGVILFRMLTGRLPFQGSMGVVLSKILTESPPSPRSLEPKIDPQLETICLRAMAKPIDQRYGACHELVADLETYLGKSTLTDSPSKSSTVVSPKAFEPTVALPKRSKQRTTLIAITTVVACLLAVVGGLTAFYLTSGAGANPSKAITKGPAEKTPLESEKTPANNETPKPEIQREPSANAAVPAGGEGKLTLEIINPKVREGGSTFATVLRTGKIDSDITVTLLCSDTTELFVDGQVKIPAGLTSAQFTLTASDDISKDGSQFVTIRAIATGYESATEVVEVEDTD